MVIYADPGRGTFRYASLVDDRLDACLLLAREMTALPSSDVLAEALGAEIGPEDRMHLLSGRRLGGIASGDAGHTICACFGIGLNVLHGAIVERRLTSVAEIGAALKAGTNCGSCVPELTAILRGAQTGGAVP